MDEKVAEEVVERLRAHRIFAAVNRRVGVYSVGGREQLAPYGHRVESVLRD